MKKETLWQLTVVGGIGLSGYLGWHLRELMLPNPAPVNISDNTLELDSTKITDEELGFLPKTIEFYLGVKNIDRRTFQLMLTNNPSQASIALAHQSSHDYLTRGAAMLQLKTSPENKPYFENQNGKILVFNNRQFDLSNLYQFHLASAIIDKSLEIFTPQDVRTGSFPEIIEQLKLLYWLKDQNLDINFESDSYAFFAPEKMITLASALYHTQRDVPKPSRIQFYRYGDSRYPQEGGQYNCGRYQNLTDLFKGLVARPILGSVNCPILISNQIDSIGIAHEIGHFVGFTSKSLDQEDFKQMTKLAEEQFGDQVTNHLDLYLSFDAAEDYRENYAETFAWYIANGTEFRQLLRQIRWWNWGAYKILSENYRFFQEKSGGIEFKVNGTVFKQEGRDEIAIGQLFLIEDKSQAQIQDKGIHLRQDPANLFLTDESHVVHNGDRVEIIDGPFTNIDSGGESYIFWKIRTPSRVPELEGWIAQEWLEGPVGQTGEIKPSTMPTKAEAATEFQAGDIVRIVDEDDKRPGILLRPQLITQGWYKNQEWPAVFDGDEVEIVEGPVPATDFITDFITDQIVEKQVNWWKVKIDRQSIKSHDLLGWARGEEGWISEDWLGEKVENVR